MIHSNKSMPANKIIGNVSELEVALDNKVVIKCDQLEIYQNKIHVLTGPSGSGKSTFLRALNRLNDCLSNARTRGSICLQIDGKETSIDKLKPTQLPHLRRKVGMVFQSPNPLPVSIEKNMLLPLRAAYKLSKPEEQEITQQALQLAGLWHEVKDRMHLAADKLSGGQQQRLCLARTLALQPEILLLDEPTASLDPQMTEQIEDTILQLADRFTIVTVSHSLAQTSKLADFIIKAEDGIISASQPT
ncbi:phosphate ABC transporter ATP-binding protein [Persicirhabdus sediminis]|uniref:Phosphate ABC transporter ATP-binding protein n=1 Tax=Persicirhabdus sediminis TaxID=454144 RepID=A0A8J7SI25_9BACT|nr:phosphate ABC transporter ATP-binding protein [Persicirhabdus sediminis]MBK1791175.1 phosphate ABC transporter ATP-binding protein [Persicirhabdus sediminis]